MLIDRKLPAASLFSGPYYFAEQLGFRKIIDITFMMASMITGTPDPEDVRKYFSGAAPGAARHRPAASSTPTTTKRNSPCASTTKMDTRCWGPGERLVFEPYTQENFEQSFKWIEQHGIFPRSEMGGGDYEAAIFH